MPTLPPNSISIRLTTEKGLTFFAGAPSGPVALTLAAALRGPPGPPGPPGPEGGTTIVVSATPPPSPIVGLLWLDIS